MHKSHHLKKFKRWWLKFLTEILYQFQVPQVEIFKICLTSIQICLSFEINSVLSSTVNIWFPNFICLGFYFPDLRYLDCLVSRFYYPIYISRFDFASLLNFSFFRYLVDHFPESKFSINYFPVPRIPHNFKPRSGLPETVFLFPKPLIHQLSIPI